MVEGQGGQALTDGPSPIEPGHELDAEGFAVAMSILLVLGVAGPVPGIAIDQRSRT